MPHEKTITCYRPTGPEELELVASTGFKAWPPRLPEQPIFYPVTNEKDAAQIARDWYVRARGVGYVTRFDVRSEFMDRNSVHTVGGSNHTEWWVPAEELEDHNGNIVGEIEVIGQFGSPTDDEKESN